MEVQVGIISSRIFTVIQYGKWKVGPLRDIRVRNMEVQVGPKSNGTILSNHISHFMGYELLLSVCKYT